MDSPQAELVAKALAEQLTATLRNIVDLDAVKQVVDRFLRKEYTKGLEKQEVLFDSRSRKSSST